MGLVVELPTEAPVLVIPGATARQGSGQVAAGFDLLLASLGATQEAETGDPSPGDDSTDSPPPVGVVVSLAVIPPVPAAALADPAQPAGRAPAESAATGIAAASIPGLPGEAAMQLSPGDASATAAGLAEGEANAGGPAEASVAPSVVEVLPAPESPTSSDGTAAAAVRGAAASSEPSPEPPAANSAEPPAESPASGPPPTEADAPAPRVVRTVGNARVDAEPPGPTSPVSLNPPGRAEGREQPVPRPSAQGLAHAAPGSAVGQLRSEAPAPAPAPAPADPAPAPAPPAQANVDRLATVIIERVEGGGGEARLHLEPADLGEVTVHIRTAGESVHVDIHAERPDAAALLRETAGDLAALLSNRGMNLGQLNVGLGARQDGAPGQQGRETRGQAPAAGEFA
uniref:flagellar hook-length control protein FliK n=1 Tax=Tepidiforma sp. TaxID=2682230 RepID=UPI002ADDBDF5